MGDQQNETAPPAAQDGGNTTIPLPRFNAVNERMKAAEARAAELEARLAALQPKPPEPAPAPQGAAPTPSTPSAAPEQGQQKNELERLRLMAHHRVPEPAVDAVLDLTSKGVSVEDAIAVVERRNPAAFGNDNRGFQPGAHAATIPGSGRQPEPPKVSERERVSAIRNNDRRHTEALKLAGRIVRGEKVD